MKNFILLLLLPLFTFCGQEKEKLPNNQSETSNPLKPVEQNATYYLIRHAEKDRSDPKNSDPELNIEGMKRAQKWAKYFEATKIDAIYITNYIRTKQTISLIAQQKSIAPITYRANHLYSDEFLKATNGKNILIVGHSNTIPQLVNKLIGKDKFKEMDDNDNSTLYKVVIHGDDKSVETINVN